MVSKTVEAIRQNALRLLADAELLCESGRYQSAVALSILSIEEAGKACLLRWKEKGWLDSDLAEHIRQSHFRKQRILYCTLPAGAITAVLAREYIQIAKTASIMPTASDLIHRVMSAIYRMGPVYGKPSEFIAITRAASVQALKEFADKDEK